MRPAVLALDVNETLSDLQPLAARLEAAGAPGHLLATWFASVLRDGFALAAAGAYADFAEIARDTLRSTLAQVEGLTCTPDEAARLVLDGLRELPLHPDVRPGLEQLHAAGMRLVTLTNGSVASTRSLLERGGAAGLVEQLLSVEGVRRWKPSPEPYRDAAASCGVAPERVMLVAVHPWDVDGALRAGLRACWIDRSGAPYPTIFREPELTCRDFAELATALTTGSQ
ncbi:MAG: haloacid dehalogenase type II [Solirubrobacteraceae bacterium]